MMAAQEYRKRYKSKKEKQFVFCSSIFREKFYLVPFHHHYFIFKENEHLFIQHFESHDEKEAIQRFQQFLLKMMEEEIKKETKELESFFQFPYQIPSQEEKDRWL